MPDIVLVTLNARHTHASLGLRCLLANLGDLAPRAQLMEFVCGAATESLAERILAQSPRLVGFGVYIWNVVETTRLIAQLRVLAPELILVVGGPEVSHELDTQPLLRWVDHVITGPGEQAFADLCRQRLAGGTAPQRIDGAVPDLDALVPPYSLYTDEDIAHRTLYVEASRGCPYKCEFCLSALDRTAIGFDTDRFLQALESLHARGARRFKFVDRTFNLKVATSVRILDFFLERQARTPDDPCFAHFELVPDHLPDALRERIARFAPGTLQFEIGIQTWNPEVQARISRRQDNARARANLAWLVEHTQAHLHVDLIAGLPGETLASFGQGFDTLHALRPHEIQLGILKRLRGAPIARHTRDFGMRYNPEPPYNVLATDALPFADLQRLARLARYWDLYANSGRFLESFRQLLETPHGSIADSPFARLLAFCDWLHARTDATHRLALERQFELLDEYVGQLQDARLPPEAFRSLLEADYRRTGARGRPAFLARGVSGAGAASRTGAAAPPRQERRLSAPATTGLTPDASPSVP